MAIRTGRIVVAFAALKLVLQLVALRPYGYFRDELYYLACANHLAFGYVDHPPFSIGALAAWRAVFGDSLVAIRLPPALLGVGLVYATGRLVIALRGGPVAVALACLAVLCAPSFVGTDHAYSMNAYDHLFWVVSALLVVGALERPVPSRWLVLGAVLGLGLLNKLSMLWFGAGLATTLVLTTSGRAAMRTRGPYLAALTAGLLLAPHVVWQVQNHWPTAEFMRNAMQLKYPRLPLGTFLRESTLIMNPAALPLTIAGVVTPFTSGARARVRPLALIFLTALAIVASSKSGKSEYLNAAYPLVFVSGSLWWERFLAPRSAAARWGVILTMALPMVGLLAVVFPFAVPVLSEPSFIAYAKRLGIAPHTSEKKALAELPQGYADMHGWDELVSVTEHAWSTLSDEERRHARIWAVAGGYGSAAAIDVLGPARGLPGAIGTHNNYWLWGYGADAEGAVVLLGGPRDRLEELFTSVVQVGTVECAYCMPYEKNKPIYVGRGMKRRWAEVWPALKHYE